MCLIATFACIYQTVDREERSIFNGLAGIKYRQFGDYMYLSVIINTTLGLGEIVPMKNNEPEFKEKQSISRMLVATHIMTSLAVNDALDSFENIKLS